MKTNDSEEEAYEASLENDVSREFGERLADGFGMLNAAELGEYRFEE